jgi:hypothetical protein
MLDVGSGPASYPIALCQRFANLKATIFDLPATLNITERFVRDAGMTAASGSSPAIIEAIRSGTVRRSSSFQYHPW